MQANARFIASCHRFGDTNMLAMGVSQPEPCPLNITFKNGNSMYGIIMNADPAGGPATDPTTDNATIGCDSATTSRCEVWSITPSNSSGKNRGKLTRLATKPRESDQDLGYFNFSFKIEVALD